LPDFVSGNIWQNLSPKPITALRATSQFRNPRANPEDVALIIAHEDNQLIALVGLLPDYINGNQELPVFSNTCWWVDQKKGKQLAIPLFLKAFSACNQRMFMTDCTPHTISILQKTNWFNFPDTPYGIRGFLKFNLHEIIPQKIKTGAQIKHLLKIADSILNFLRLPYLSFCKLRFSGKQITTTVVSKIDDELLQFIHTHNKNEFIRRSGVELEWILKFPWITATPNTTELYSYPFSRHVKSFEQYLIKVSAHHEILGLMMISIRDGHMKVPYAYFENVNAAEMLLAIYQQALQKNITTLTIFDQNLTSKMQTEKHPFIFRKKISRLIAISKSLDQFFLKDTRFQDGDGDVVFT